MRSFKLAQLMALGLPEDVKYVLLLAVACLIMRLDFDLVSQTVGQAPAKGCTLSGRIQFSPYLRAAHRGLPQAAEGHFAVGESWAEVEYGVVNY